MATESRKSLPSVEDKLWQEVFAFEFHQAVKLLEQLNPNALALGEGVTPSNDAALIKSRVSLTTPSSDIYSLKRENVDMPPTLNVNFWGIAGLQGPLPTPYTELILERLRNKDPALKEFLDIFNHRLISILHRIRKKYIPALNTLKPHQTITGQCIQAFTGIKTKYSQNVAKEMNPQSLMFYSGLLWHRPRSASGLKHILSHYFGVPVSIGEFQGKWLPLEKNQWTHIGSTGQFNKLGKGAMLGTKVWNTSTRSTIRIGPINQETFRSFLKSGRAYSPLLKLIQFYLPPQYEKDINLVIYGKDICKTKLDGQTQLGWTSWLKTKETTEDDDQVRLF